MKKLSANIYHHDGGLVEAEIHHDEKIHQVLIQGGPRKDLPLALSGFVDLHVHGGGGHDFMEGSFDIAKIPQTHLRHGTTSYLATTMTAPHAELLKAFRALAVLYNKRSSNQARLLGVHLEGPYISAEKLGAQPDFTRKASLAEIKELHALVPIRVITLAPEVFNHLDIIQELIKMKIVVQIGHTNGSYEQGVQALEQGAKSFTHLFNAMSPLHHRAPGMVGAALAHADYAELIPDLLHVHPGAIKVALRSIPNLYFVTDSTAATGMPDGDYKLGAQSVHKCLGGVRLADGTLAGSALTMDQAFRNLKTLELTVAESSARLSKIPAQLIGEDQRGEIKMGNFADFILLDADDRLSAVIVEGEYCEQ